jgi:hypothetical protein
LLWKERCSVSRWFRSKPTPALTKLQKGEIRILCIGESTTAAPEKLAGKAKLDHSYPAKLQALLNQRLPGRRVRVFNRGRIGAHSGQIAESLPGWLKKIQPHFVISMVGINDRFYFQVPYRTNSGRSGGSRWFQRSRLLRLLGLVSYELQRRFSSQPRKNQPLQTPYYPHGLHQDLAGWVYKILPLAREQMEGLTSTTHPSAAVKERWVQVETSLLRLVRYARKQKADEGLLPPRLRELFLDAHNFLAQLWLKQQRWKPLQSRQKRWLRCLKNSQKTLPGHPFFDGHLAALYTQMKQHKLAQKHRKAHEKSSGRASRATLFNLRLIQRHVQRSRAVLIGMQYPLLSVRPLQSLWGMSSRRLQYVSNRTSFAKAVQKQGYSTLFTDRFAGSFGHCTPRGNQLIANNVWTQVLHILQKTGKKGATSP